jgi:hypothetical protein
MGRGTHVCSCSMSLMPNPLVQVAATGSYSPPWGM